jgi:hypothetical protein
VTLLPGLAAPDLPITVAAGTVHGRSGGSRAFHASGATPWSNRSMERLLVSSSVRKSNLFEQGAIRMTTQAATTSLPLDVPTSASSDNCRSRLVWSFHALLRRSSVNSCGPSRSGWAMSFPEVASHWQKRSSEKYDEPPPSGYGTTALPLQRLPFRHSSSVRQS